ncbi:receptor activity-modifying protein 2 isoform X2 [Erythrolamprus reginae]|uniref:receptor activity-modifying protein 2 isoform X2 n=1 Tax=Erythrolamprus reginae TaxID=121349 RepID=UPI00396C6C75
MNLANFYSPVRGKEVLPVILIQISSWSQDRSRLPMLQSGRLCKMDGHALLWRLLLLISTVAITLHAHSGTAVPFQNGTVFVNNQSLTYQELKDLVYKYRISQCWDLFTEQMANISKIYWCDWKTIRRPYNRLRECLESKADDLKLSYPNSLAEEHIITSHHNYFVNCTPQNQPLKDPPENILLALIITPICLIPFLVALVVLKSKDGEMKL